MTWLLTVDPGKRGCGCALWSINAPVSKSLHAAAYIQPLDETLGGHEVQLRREELVDVCTATASEVVVWASAQIGRPVSDLYLCTHLVCELPRTYGGRAKKGDANDNVVPLSVVVGMIAGALGCPTALVWPQDWKGTIPKPERQSEPYIVQERVKAHLTAEEAARVEWPRNKKLQWDVADAIGIGMAYLGRAFKKIG